MTERETANIAEFIMMLCHNTDCANCRMPDCFVKNIEDANDMEKWIKYSEKIAKEGPYGNE